MYKKFAIIKKGKEVSNVFNEILNEYYNVFNINVNNIAN